MAFHFLHSPPPFQRISTGDPCSPLHQTAIVQRSSTMAKLLLLPFSLCLLVLFNGGLASRQWFHQGGKGMPFRERQFDQCRIDKLDAVEPTNRVEAEAGVIETWDHNNDQFQCAGAAVSRITIEQQGLFLPSYSNAPELVYIERGRGFQGVLIPGCPETFQDSQQSQPGRGSRMQDQHQKIRHFREGDIIAIPAGAAHWCYNDGDTPVVAIVLHHMNNYANQLDQNPRKFYLAGSPEEEFDVRGRQSPRERPYRAVRGEREHKNVFFGFDEQFLADAFNVDTETARRLRGQDDGRRNIIRVKGDFSVVRPPLSREEREWQERGESGREWERPSHGSGRWDVANGLEETICSMRLRENIGDPSRADVYTPEAGRISHANGHNLPILRHLQLSAERGFLYDNAIHAPHWNLNAHSVIYVIRGSARVQVVDNYGQSVFNGELRKGQILTVPQNFAVVKRSGDEGFEWVSFKTSDNAMISPLAGRTSAIRALPVQVLANAYQISEEEARRLKFNRQETTLFAAKRSAGVRAEA